MNNVCCIIVSYSNYSVLKQSVLAIRNQVDHIVIVDNFSSKQHSNMLNDSFSNLDYVTTVHLNNNYGIGHAINKGVKIALANNYEWILTMDQDSIASPDMVSELLKCTQKSVGDKIYRCIFSSYDSNKESTLSCEEVYMGITSGNLLHYSVFLDYGYYDEDLFIDSVDFEFFLRLKNNSVVFIRSNDGKMSHSLGNNDRHLKSPFFSYTHPPIRRYYMFRNHLFVSSHYFLKNPVYITWKTFNMFFLFVSILIFEKNKTDNLKMIFSGLYHFAIGKKGPLS